MIRRSHHVINFETFRLQRNSTTLATRSKGGQSQNHLHHLARCQRKMQGGASDFDSKHGNAVQTAIVPG